MGLGMEVILAQATAPGAVTTNFPAAGGTTLTIRNAPFDAPVFLLNIWADFQANGFIQVRSPKLHDNVRGYRLDTTISEVKPLIPAYMKQILIPQDAIIVEGQGSAVVGDIESAALLVYYENLPGTDGRFISPQELFDRSVQTLATENTITTAAGGGFTGSEAINAEADLFKANTDYALIGYLVDTECAIVRWVGPDFGNLGLGGPGDELGRDYTRSWFLDLAFRYQKPMIPVFNAANKAGTLLSCAQDENAAAVTVTSLLAELAPRR